MATYLPGSNVQADAMQTLYLMNPSFTGYGDSANANNMILISSPASLVQGNSLSNTAQQQHYIGLPLPPVLTEKSVLQQPTTISSMSTSNMRNLFPNHTSNQTYNLWNGQGDIQLISAEDMAQASQSAAACLTSVNSCPQSASDISHYNVNRDSLSPLHERQTTYSQNNIDFGLNMENRQVSLGHGQGLSLSLSSQPPSAPQLKPFHLQVTEPHVTHCAPLSHVASEDNPNTAGSFPNNWTGNVCSFRTSSDDGTLGMQYHNALNNAESSRLAHLELGASVLAGGLLMKSRYLKAAQQLLDEVVSFGRDVKGSSGNSTNAQTWMSFGFGFDSHYAKEKILSDTLGKHGTTDVVSASARLNENITELTPIQRQELQLKKAKLMGMYDEVNRRYRQYYSQLQIVVSSFESATGLGAAKTYTALALQTISRHFRCLRDAIGLQIQATSKTLGEEDPILQGKGERANLHFVDQQLHQQRALQQLGIIQQHTWRPQRGLPERSVSILRAWLFEHFLHPYPKDADKIILARQTGLTRNQVSNWFINARVRLWKPMVEEMYQEETKDAEMEASGSEKKGQGEVSGVRGGECQRHQTDMKEEAKQERRGDQCNSDMMVPTTGQGINMAGSTRNSHFHHEDDPRKRPKVARTEICESASMLSSDISADIEMRLQETRAGDILELDNKFNMQGHHRNNFSLSHDSLLQAESLGEFGAYANIEGTMMRYPGHGNVSLTLGLQHCDALSLSQHGQKHYLSPQVSQVQTAENGQNEQADFYSINNNTHEAVNFQNRKRYATQFLHRDFVA